METVYAYFHGGKREDAREDVVCPLCVPSNDGRILAVWDGQEWTDLAVWEAWRRDWCTQTGHDAGPAWQRWNQADHALLPHPHLQCFQHVLWILLMTDEQLTPERAVVLVRGGLGLGDGSHWRLLVTGSVPELTHLVDSSWARRERYLDLLWSRLDDRLLRRAVTLALQAGPKLDLRLSPDLRSTFEQEDERVRIESGLRWQDLHAWRDDSVYASYESHRSLSNSQVEAMLALRSRVLGRPDLMALDSAIDRSGSRVADE